MIAKLGNAEEKREVMVNKYKLKGEDIFIENDLTWEERKVQERISKWFREMRNKGNEVKIGFGKVRVNGLWRYWRDVEKEAGNEKIEKDSERREGEVVGRNRWEIYRSKDPEQEEQETGSRMKGRILGERPGSENRKKEKGLYHRNRK